MTTSLLAAISRTCMLLLERYNKSTE